MKCALVFFVVLVVSTTIGPAQTHHDTRYIGGGASTRYFPTGGIQLYDAGTGMAAPITTLRAMSMGHRMDWDNQNVVFTEGSTLRRADPTNTSQPPQTIASLPSTFKLERLVVNQDGDYVVTCVQPAGSSMRHVVLRITRQQMVSTIFTTSFVPRTLRWEDHIAIDIDTGHYLVTENARPGSAPVYTISDGGTVTTWNSGGGGTNRGWDGPFSMRQNHRNGFLEAPELDKVFQLRPGTAGRAVLATLPPGVSVFMGSSGIDLQTAASQRIVATGATTSLNRTVLYTIDRATFAVTSVTITNQPYSSQVTHNFDFDFYRGRHLQTVKTATRQWDIHISCPRFPGKSYALVAGLSGVRPGIALADKRRINLNPDALVQATLNNWLAGVFNPGPGVLDASGEAVGRLNLSAVGRVGAPIWLAVAIIDPAAPNGFAYLPDTHVMRL